MYLFNITKLYRAGNESLSILSYRIIDIISQSNNEQAINAKQFLNHKQVSNRFKTAIGPRHSAETTTEINDSFTKRYRLFGEIYKYVNGLIKAPDEDTRTSANLIFPILNQYGLFFGNIKISDQSIRYIRIVEALKSPDLADALQKLQLTNKVNELDNAQREYETLYMGRRNKRLGIETASNIRKELINAIKLNVEELNWMALQSDSADLLKLSEEVNLRFGEINISQTRTKNTSESVVSEDTVNN